MNRCGCAINCRGSTINCRGWTIESVFIDEPRLFIADEQRWLDDERLWLAEPCTAHRQPLAPIRRARGRVPPIGDGVVGARAARELRREDEDLRKVIFPDAYALTRDLTDAKELAQDAMADRPE
ncbi:MAG: hypothetical protein ACLP1X_20065 [Polyangiaceae bacterium]